MIHFWNGNKSPARQAYEYQLLELVLGHAGVNESIHNDTTDYPKAKDEGGIFERGADLLVTVAGNRKFADTAFIEVPIPLCKGVLGHRVAIIARSRQDEFAIKSPAELKQQRVGVPATWVDAELFRYNGYYVMERGSLPEVMQWVANGEIDYLTLGVNEAAEILSQFGELTSSLMIEPTKVLQYPFPVVFYVNPAQPKLAEQLAIGLQHIIGNGALERLFDDHFAQVLKSINLASRERIEMVNPLLPLQYQA
ncbi:amino acid ABC transporter substrate-binding protein [Vibrio sp. JPW-9-11-11]|uniref:transporter substrate-binding domain-containing protein n=1 Tax=Vibrio sp. JPW-9-11-11 TaxID=1416532 RepID=UPI001593BBB1|nr:transporter substrate-binding domain-containing protein [Vibrio sp. JPW-9-11-11]NVD08801.1 amino acid ABC transporter substrate-binding protein [Vibrio sp. JPW-9-11-11]